MELKIAERSQVKIKMALTGPAGAGKTLGALRIAYGLCGNWEHIAVIDTENHSASLYAQLGVYRVLNISSPYSPEVYIQAVEYCVNEGIEVIIIDSMSHEWEGAGGILDIHSNMTGNSFTNWSKVTPRHNSFVQSILQSPVHVIGTIRCKQDYVINEKNGKNVPEKVGLKGITREGMDYEMTTVFDLDIFHNVSVSKDRTGLFADKSPFKITEQTGVLILEWCNQGNPYTSFTDRINACKSVAELSRLYFLSPEYQKSHIQDFSSRKNQLESANRDSAFPKQVK